MFIKKNVYVVFFSIKNDTWRHVTRRQGEIHLKVTSFCDTRTFHLRSENWKFSPWSEMDILTVLDDILNVFI